MASPGPYFTSRQLHGVTHILTQIKVRVDKKISPLNQVVRASLNLSKSKSVLPNFCKNALITYDLKMGLSTLLLTNNSSYSNVQDKFQFVVFHSLLAVVVFK